MVYLQTEVEDPGMVSFPDRTASHLANSLDRTADT